MAAEPSLFTAAQADGNAAESAGGAADARVAATTEAVAPAPHAAAEAAGDAASWGDLPYDFDRCVVDVRIILLPCDGDAAGRDVILSATTHEDDPLIVAIKAGELGALPAPLAALVERLKEFLPERGRAAAEKRRRAEEEKLRSQQRRNLQSQPRAAAKPPAAPPPQALLTTQPAAPAATTAATTATTTATSPQAQTGQMGLFG